jgi:hypothetical protein
MLLSKQITRAHLRVRQLKAKKNKRLRKNISFIDKIQIEQIKKHMLFIAHLKLTVSEPWRLLIIIAVLDRQSHIEPHEIV